MTITLKFDNGEKLGRKFSFGVKRYGERSIKSAQRVAFRVKDDIETEGRADIAAGGNFSSERWQEGFEAKVSYQSRYDLSVRATHSVFYWRVFEYGATILGRPMLWIPLSFARDAQGVRARDYPGPLFRVDRKRGAPLLLTTGGAPKYFGKESVTIPQKWHLREVVRRVSRRMSDYYKQEMKNG
jgi:hypothetical protein